MYSHSRDCTCTMNRQNQMYFLQPAGVNDGIIVVDGKEHVFVIPTLPKTLDEWKKEYTYRQFQMIAKHLRICARSTQQMSLQTRVVEDWIRSKDLVAKDPACKNLFPPVPVNASTKSPDDQSKSASSIVVASKPEPDPDPDQQMLEKCSRSAKEDELTLEQDRKELKRMRESLGFLNVKVDRSRPLSKLGKEVRKRKEEQNRLAFKMKQKILKIVQVGIDRKSVV